MSEGVDLIDIYADEEFNQVRGISSSFGFSSSLLTVVSLSPQIIPFSIEAFPPSGDFEDD